MTFVDAFTLVMIVVVLPVVVATLYLGLKVVLWDLPRRAWIKWRDDQRKDPMDGWF